MISDNRPYDAVYDYALGVKYDFWFFSDSGGKGLEVGR